MNWEIGKHFETVFLQEILDFPPKLTGLALCAWTKGDAKAKSICQSEMVFAISSTHNSYLWWNLSRA